MYGDEDDKTDRSIGWNVKEKRRDLQGPTGVHQVIESMQGWNGHGIGVRKATIQGLQVAVEGSARAQEEATR